jgi:hypothetical protein
MIKDRIPTMNTFRTILTLLMLAGVLHAQSPVLTDTTIVFTPSSPIVPNASATLRAFANSYGMDIMLSNNGFALGGFLRHEWMDDLSWTLTLCISDVKDDAEVEQFTYWNSYVPYKKNRLLMIPLMVGVQYRLFREDIVDNFRPYVSAGAGPTMIFVAPYAKDNVITLPNGLTYTQTEEIEFFSSLKHGQAKYTVGGYIGAGAYFGIDRSTVSGLGFRYYYIPFPSGISVMEEQLKRGVVKRFGGFYISLSVGSYF